MQIVEHYEDCLQLHGDTHKGVDWPNERDMLRRYEVMLDVHRFDPSPLQLYPSILDFGCGTANLLGYMKHKRLFEWTYQGLDLSQKFVDVAKHKYPKAKFYCSDVLTSVPAIEPVDYILMNGVFTEKCELSFDEMFEFFGSVLMRMFPLAKRGIAFNTMSKAVDWERDDLFHMPVDLLTFWLCRNLTRHFIIRNDYGLYEYTTYIYH